MKTSPWISLVCLWITTYTFVWSALYNILRRCLFKKESSGFSARLVSSIHALTVTSLAYRMYLDKSWLPEVLGSDITERQADILAAILGYVLFDFVWCLSSNCEPFIMKAHHTVFIFLTVMVLTRAKSGTELIFIYAVNQVTIFLLQLRWFLRFHGFNNGLVESLFFLSFFIERIYLTFTLYVRISQSSLVPMEFKVFLSFHCLIGYIFSYHVLVLVLKKFYRVSTSNSPATQSVLKKSTARSTMSFDRYESMEEEGIEDGRGHGLGDSDSECQCDKSD